MNKKVSFETLCDEPIDIIIGEYAVRNVGADNDSMEIKHLEIDDWF